MFFLGPNTNEKKKKKRNRPEFCISAHSGPPPALLHLSFVLSNEWPQCLHASKAQSVGFFQKKNRPGFFHGFLAAGKLWKCFHVTVNVETIETKPKRSKRVGLC